VCIDFLFCFTRLALCVVELFGKRSAMTCLTVKFPPSRVRRKNGAFTINALVATNVDRMSTSIPSSEAHWRFVLGAACHILYRVSF
jgi:hypothetical protein